MLKNHPYFLSASIMALKTILISFAFIMAQSPVPPSITFFPSFSSIELVTLH
jgi:hypothetical protein